MTLLMDPRSAATRCPDCRHESPLESIYCPQCGRGLGRRCARCGVTSALNAKFCGTCGDRLPEGTPPAPPPAIEAPASARDAERRQITVMFCDLVGSSPLSARLDPEDYRAVIDEFLGACTETIRRFDGYVAQFLGDGILAYFGYPTAREDDVRRAVQAALDVVPAVRRISLARVGDPGHLEVRIGIDTGPVVVDMRSAVGTVPNIAARLQALAMPNTVLVSEATHRLIAGYFACEALGPQSLKGFDEAVPVYRVTAPGQARSRFELAVQAGLTPFVGRRDELQFLCGRWDMVKTGSGQVMSVCGEPGIGKSRLLQALGERLAADPHVSLEARCDRYFANSALHPIIESLHQMLGGGDTSSPQEKLRRLEAAFANQRFAEPDSVPLIAALLSLPHPDGHPPLAVTPERQRQRTLDTLVTWLTGVSERQPVRLTVEDLHWADPSTVAFVDLLIRRLASARVYVLLTFRPEFVAPWVAQSAPWAARSHLSHISLARLDRAESEQMVERLTGGKPLPTEVARQITVKTDGVPLFVEELTKMILEAPWLEEHDDRYVVAASRPVFDIPTTLRDSLTARLDQLADHRAVAQIGACVGREFSYELIRALAPGDAPALAQSLSALVEAELLYQHGHGTHARYAFKHAMIQDAAYNSLLKTRRQHYHQAIARLLTSPEFADAATAEPELIAHHYTAAGLAAEAIPYWQQAGQRAAARAAHAEAVQHYRTALELLATLPSGHARLQLELGLRVLLALSLASTQGYGAVEVERTYARAQELCQQLGEGVDLFPILRGLSTFYMVRNDQLRARALALDCVRIATETQKPEYLIEADTALGYALSYLGEFEDARAVLERGLACYEAHAGRSLVYVTPQDPGVACLVMLADVLWWLGYPDQALRRQQDALALAQTLEHPFNLTFVHIHSSLFHQMRREPVEAERHARQGSEIAARHGFDLWVSCATLNLGIAQAALGRPAEAIPMLERELVAWAEQGAESTRTYYLAGLAGAYHIGGRLADAQRAIDEGTALAERPSAEHMYDVLLYWLRGEIRLSQSPDAHAEATADFRHAIAAARRQRARSLELRVTMSLCRLLRRRGARDEARALLQPLYEWFTEGFETVDLRDARALLAKLSA
jgi:class 3 adenylate cyclase/tetratricopeptide (TPR) repeat protein